MKVEIFQKTLRGVRESAIPTVKYHFSGIYSDSGISGAKEKRPGFQSMLEACRKGEIDLIFTKSISRLARNAVLLLETIRELKSLGVAIVFEEQNINTLTTQGELVLSILASIAEEERKSVSENIKWTFRNKFKQGMVMVDTNQLLGYDKDENGNLVINQEESKIIQYIFDQYLSGVRIIYKEFLDGYGYYQIASRLTEKGIPTNQKNMTWSWSTVLKILTNEKIKGDTLFQKTYHEDYITKKRRKNTGELAQYYLENSHPAIIDKETWECVQLELERQKKYCEDHHIKTYHRNNEKHPLSAKICCSICGCTFVLMGSKRVGEEGKKYWRCGSFNGKKGKEIEGKLFTPSPHHRSSTNPYVINRLKDPKPRQMLCTDIKVAQGEPEQAFILAWNDLVKNYDKYSKAWLKIINESENALLRYRAKEMLKLVSEIGLIDTFNFELFQKVLNHIEVDMEGRTKVLFLGYIQKYV